MKNPPGYGSIDRMKGNRRKPYRVRITTDYSMDETGRAGGDLLSTKRILGHSVPDITERVYTATTDAELLSAIDRFYGPCDLFTTFAKIFSIIHPLTYHKNAIKNAPRPIPRGCLIKSPLETFPPSCAGPPGAV